MVRGAAIAAAAVFLLGGVSAVWYGVYKTHGELAVVRQLPFVGLLPVARVGGKTVSFHDYAIQIDAAKTFLSGSEARAQGLSPEITQEIRQLSYERAIRIVAVEVLAERDELVVTPLDIDRAYDTLISYAGTSTTKEEIEGFLRNQFGWDVPSFKNYIVRPALIEDLLKQRRVATTQNVQAFEQELQAFLKGDEVKRYLQF